MITPKVRKPELSILYATRRLVLIYISTKYHQSISKGIQVIERKRSFTPTPTLTLTPTPTASVPKTICPPHTSGGRMGHKKKTKKKKKKKNVKWVSSAEIAQRVLKAKYHAYCTRQFVTLH